MSSELRDFRGKITIEADCALESESQSTGKERQEIVREILHEWAVQRIKSASVLDRKLRAEGFPGIAEGIEGNRGECRGKTGRTRD